MQEMNCTCEKKHHCAPIDAILIEDGAIDKLPSLLEQYHRIFVVADQNTWRVAGERVVALLSASGQLSHSFVFPGEVLPNAEAIGQIVIHAGPFAYDAVVDSFAPCPLPDFILGVGSGVINDVCRLSSFRLRLPYGICATAPSMDGYASAGSPMLFDGTKDVYKRQLCNRLADRDGQLSGVVQPEPQRPGELCLHGRGTVPAGAAARHRRRL